MSLTKDTETVVGVGFRKSKKSWSGWMFMAPFIVVFALVLLAPILYAVYLSLFETRMIGGSQFVGFDNFLRAFKDAQFWDGVLRILKFFAMQVPIMLGLALAAALAIDSSRLKGKNFFRIGIFVPYAVPAVVATLMWGFMFGDRFGLIGNLNEFFNINIPSLLSANLILLAIANIQIWTFTGYNMLIFYSSLRTIPEELYEAAELDGDRKSVV